MPSEAAVTGAPAKEGRRVPEAVALQVVVLDLADALRTHRLPRQVLARAPAAGRAGHALGCVAGCALRRRLLLGPAAPRVPGKRVVAQRRELLDQRAPRRHRERRRHADVVKDTRVVVEAEQERADCLGAALLGALVPAKAGDDAVGGARVLDLEHRPLAGLVARARRLGDDAVEAG